MARLCATESDENLHAAKSCYHGAAVLIDFNNENLALPLTADVYNVIPAQTGTGVMSELANGGSGGGTGLSASSLVDTTGAATQSSLLCFPRW